MKLIQTFSALVIAAAVATPVWADHCNSHKAASTSQCTSDKDIVALASGADNFKTLVAAVKAAGLVEVLQAKVLGVLIGPVFSLQNVLSANLRGLNTVINARIQQLGGTTNA